MADDRFVTREEFQAFKIEMLEAIEKFKAGVVYQFGTFAENCELLGSKIEKQEAIQVKEERALEEESIQVEEVREAVEEEPIKNNHEVEEKESILEEELIETIQSIQEDDSKSMESLVIFESSHDPMARSVGIDKEIPFQFVRTNQPQHHCAHEDTDEKKYAHQCFFYGSLTRPPEEQFSNLKPWGQGFFGREDLIQKMVNDVEVSKTWIRGNNILS